MYDYYYELDVLFFLRLARYLHGQDPAALKKILSMAPEFDLLLLCELCESITWAICSQVIIETELLWNEYFGEEFEITLEGRGFITKCDGAEDSDIESVKCMRGAALSVQPMNPIPAAGQKAA